MKSTPRNYDELKSFTLSGDVALIELEYEERSIITDVMTANDGKATYTGRGFFIEAGSEAADWVKHIPTGTLVLMEGVDLNPTINESVTNVPHIRDNPNFPAFSLLDHMADDFGKTYSKHPTILLRNPSYHIVAYERSKSRN